MPAKRFGAVALTADTPAVLATGTADTDSTVTLVVNNHSGLTATVLVGYQTGSDTPTGADLVRPPQQVSAGGHLEIKGIALEEGYKLVVEVNIASLTAIAYGFYDAQ